MIPRSIVRCFSTSKVRTVDYTHAVIGGGIVGVAVAAELASIANHNVVLLEKNSELGQETTSRNSEVIHAGLYYPEDSLKMQLCLAGKSLIYNEAFKAGVEMQNCGKWIVAQTDEEKNYLEQVHERTKQLGVPTEFIGLKKAKMMEPHIVAGKAVLSSPTTGIISAHSLLSYLESRFQENGGEIALGSEVKSLDYNASQQEFSILVTSEEEEIELVTNNVINCAGLYACEVSNMLLPLERKVEPRYAKGNYFSYNKAHPKVNRLVYPCPTKNIQSLGTHLTIDLGGQIKFGPDLEWVDSATDYSVSDLRLELVYNDVKEYFPAVAHGDLSPSYCGIRPKLAPVNGKPFQDFIIREETDFKGFVNLLGIESPGLTASMAIGKYVANLLQ